MKTRWFHILMFVILVAVNVLWLDLFRDHSVETWRYLARPEVKLGDFSEAQRHLGSLGPLEKQYEFHWSHSEDPGFIVMVNESTLSQDRYDVASSNLTILIVWALVTALTKYRGSSFGR